MWTISNGSGAISPSQRERPSHREFEHNVSSNAWHTWPRLWLGLLRAQMTERATLASLAHRTTLDSGQLTGSPLDGHLSLCSYIWRRDYYAREVRPNKRPHLALLAYVAMSSDNVHILTYAVSQKAASSDKPSNEHSSSRALEGQRALRMAVFTCHFQRILDALPEPGSSTNSLSGIRPKSARNVKPQKIKYSCCQFPLELAAQILSRLTCYLQSPYTTRPLRSSVWALFCESFAT